MPYLHVVAAVTWADSLTAFGTVGAVVSSIVLASFSFAVSTRDRKKQKALAAVTHLERQAQLVQWWVEPCDLHESAYKGMLSTYKVYTDTPLDVCWGSKFVLRNASDQPISNIVVGLNRDLVVYDEKVPTSHVGPRQIWEQHLSGSGHSLLEDPYDSLSDYVAFTDQHGRRWIRSATGVLVQDMLDSEKRGRDASARQEALGRAFRREHARVRADPNQGSSSLSQRVKDTIYLTASSAAKRAYVRRRVNEGDRIAFAALQRLPTGAYDRRAAEDWYRWRSGEMSGESFLRRNSVY